MKLAIIFGGVSFEHEISIVSAIALKDILKFAAINHSIKTELEFTLPKDHRYGGRPAEIPENLEPVIILKNAVEEITGNKEIIKGSPYWSETSILILDLNIPSVYCAAGDITNCHTYYERVNVKEFINSIKVFTNMIIDFCGVS